MRSDLHDDPAVFRLASLLNIDKFAVIGRLHTFWSWVDRHSVDGFVDGATSTVVDEVVRCEGFAESLEKVKWLDIADDGIRIPKFDRHNGVSAKQRGQKNERQARWRANKDASVDAHVDAQTSTDPSTREEKSKSKRNTPIPPAGAVEPEETGAGKPARKAAIALQTFLDDCRAKGEKPILETDPVFEYADTAGVPLEFLRLHWLEFKARYCEPDAKRYKNWRMVYRKCVRANWFRLWFFDSSGACSLTTAGEQARRIHVKDAA